MGVLRSTVLAAALATAGAAEAHVGADPGQATAGAYQAVRFRVGHGCNDVLATTRLRLEIPDGMPSARPQPKPGWTLSIEHASADPASPVTAITWSGRLPADQFDEFAVFFHLPDTPGTLYFPAVQTCDGDEQQWTEVPDPGETQRLQHPAPALRLVPAAGAPDGGHHH